MLALARLAEADPAAAPALLARLRTGAQLRARLIGVLGASSALGDHLAAHPADWRLLDDPATAPPDLLAAVGADPADPPAGTAGSAARGAGDDVVTDLRTAYRRHLLVLAARDLGGELSLDEAAAALADLAAAALSAGLAVALAGLRASRPDAVPARLAVVGMGKCGGRELNYVSDVDVIFVAEPVGDAEEEGALRTATALAAELVRVCGLVAWPVDAALRPEGKMGPLVRTLASHQAYYRRWARTWEFQALLKARPVAGDGPLGQSYVDALAPLVWTAAGRDHFVDDVQAMRRRVEERLPPAVAGRELKLGRGGLRDVEFAVQLLQLVHGRADPALHVPSTLDALAALSAGGYVGRADGDTLAASYRFLRTVEHRLQLQRLRRTHVVPDDPGARRWLARALGYRPDHRGDAVAVFDAEWALHAREVRRLHEKLFYRPLLHAVARVPSEQLRLTTEEAGRRLEALGFADPGGALRHLSALIGGVSRRAAIQRALLPVVLQALADAPDPDGGLLAYRTVSDALGTTPWFLRFLRDEGQVVERLAQLLGTSRYVAELLERAPEALRLLGDDAELRPRSAGALRTSFRAAAARHDAAAAVAAARALRRHELLRVASADVLGLLDSDEVGEALTDVASATLEAALDAACRAVAAQRGPLPTRLGGDRDRPARRRGDRLRLGRGRAVRARPGAGRGRGVGRLGGARRRRGDAPAARTAGAGPAAAGGRVAAAGGAQRAAGADARLLRGVLPALVVAVGGAGAAARLARRGRRRGRRGVRVRRGPGALPGRRAARRGRDRDPPAQGPGGLRAAAAGGGSGDPHQARPRRARRRGVDGAAAPAPARGAGRGPAHHRARCAALAAARDAGLLLPDDAAALEAAWRMATRARNAVVLVRGRPSDQLPRLGRDLLGVMRVVGYPPGRDPGQFLDDYRRATRRARQVVERVFYD